MRSALSVQQQHALVDLTEAMWRHRSCLEEVIYHVEVQTLVVDLSRNDLVRLSSDLLDDVVDRCIGADEERHEASIAANAALGLPAETTLGALARELPEPFNAILSDHLESYREKVSNLQESLTKMSSSSKAALSICRNLLAGETVATGYSSTGAATHRSSVPILFDSRV